MYSVTIYAMDQRLMQLLVLTPSHGLKSEVNILHTRRVVAVTVTVVSPISSS